MKNDLQKLEKMMQRSVSKNLTLIIKIVAHGHVQTYSFRYNDQT